MNFMLNVAGFGHLSVEVSKGTGTKGCGLAVEFSLCEGCMMETGGVSK